MKIIDILNPENLKKKFASYMNEEHELRRKNANGGAYATTGKPVFVQKVRQLKLMAYKVAIVSLAVLAQPMIATAGKLFPLSENSADMEWLPTFIMAFVVAVNVIYLWIHPAETIPDDEDYERFAKTVKRIFIGMSVALPVFDWLRMSWFNYWSISVTKAYCSVAGVSIMVALLVVAICTATNNAYYRWAWFRKLCGADKILALPSAAAPHQNSALALPDMAASCKNGLMEK